MSAIAISVGREKPTGETQTQVLKRLETLALDIAPALGWKRP